MTHSSSPPPRGFWRSLDELAGSPEFAERLLREFPENAAEWTDPISRRHFLTLMGASLALAGLTGCTSAPPSDIVPYSRSAETPTPGQPLLFATSMTLCGVALGLLVKSHDGRPTKVEGNPRHPASLGATDSFAQASILDLYDPDRSQTVLHRGQPSSWGAAWEALRSALEGPRRRGGRGLAILTETITSPSMGDWLIGQRADSLRSAFPEARWHQYDPARSDAPYEGARRAFGAPYDAVYNLREADVVVSLDADLFAAGPRSVRWAHDFSQRRRVRDNQTARMNRLYAIESSPTLTGAAADHRLAMRARDVEPFARALAGAVGLPVDGSGDARWVRAIADDLRLHQGASLVIAGDGQPAAVHALAHAINVHLQNVGRTVRFIDPIEVRADNQMAGLRELVESMAAGRVEVLLILGSNPVYTAPADLDFAAALRRVPAKFHLGLSRDETAFQCDWHLPRTHFLEEWGDARSDDGTVSLLQPLIAPLYGGRSVAEVLAFLLTGSERGGLELLRDSWRDHWPRRTADFGRDWRQAVHDGFLAETARPSRTVRQRDGALAPAGDAPTGVEIILRPDPTLFDGRFANNGWLQELPKPLTKLTWGNAALMSPAMAESLGVRMHPGGHGGEHGESIADMVSLQLGERTVEAPAWVVPGHPDGSVTLHLGQGRTRAGRVGSSIGVNAYPLRTSTAPSFAGGLGVTRLDTTTVLACTQAHHGMEGRDLVRVLRAADVRRPPPEDAGHDNDRRLIPLTLYPPPDLEPAENQWGMAIDLGLCTGCSACVVACQAENNIPVVGKAEVARGREMHWLRVDRYHRGDDANPETVFQPVPCMHCENAPCEFVCPVAATVHSADGLNDQVYNRCVGTRYCSNNCPYKVRRFNFFEYADFATEVVRLGRNPEVTVRSRGVMEKCTYCVQRIRQAQTAAIVDGRSLGDGDVVTACQAACPAQAIVFGNINDRASGVARDKAEPRNYSLLADLNTRPRTTYLAAVRNPNPELER